MSAEQQRARQSRIPQNFEQASQLIGGRETSDLAITILIPFSFVVFLLYANLINLVHAGIGVGVIIVLNYVFFTLFPDNGSIVYWIRSLYSYARLPKYMPKYDTGDVEDEVEIEYTTAATGGRNPTQSGGFNFLELEGEASDVTLIEEIADDDGVVKLRDGSFVAGVEVHGMGMMLASDSERRRATEDFESALNVLEYPVTVHGTSRQFEIDNVIDRYESRLEDGDVQERPIMERIMETKRQYLKQRVKPLGTNNREYCVLVRVTHDNKNVNSGAFDFNVIKPGSPAANFLNRIGFGTGSGDDGNMTAEDEMIVTAKDRADTVSSRVSRGTNISTDPMSSGKLADTIRYYWRREGVNKEAWDTPAGVVGESGTNTSVHNE